MLKAFICILLFIFLPCASAFSADSVGAIIKTEGKVYSYLQSTPQPHRIKSTPNPIGYGDRVQTRKDSLAYLNLIDGSKIVVEELSSLLFSQQSGFSNEHGTILFDIKKTGQSRGVTVTTNVVTIGVKGTRFAVVQRDGATAIFLKEGQLNLRPGQPEGMFQLQDEIEESYQKKLQAMRENFDNTRSAMATEHSEKSRQMREAFERNQALMQQGKLSEVAEFDLDSNMAVLIDGKKLFNIEFTADWDKKFSRFDHF